MNAVLPSTESTGTLTISEVFDFYDGPKLFICQNLTGNYFLGYWVGADEVGELYWLVPISKDRYFAVRSGTVSLRDAIASPELGYVLQCRVHFVGGATDSTRLAPDELNPALIPDSDEVVQLHTQTLEARMDPLELARAAVANKRDVLGLHFEFPGNREDGPTKAVGKLLVAIQDFLDALGQKIIGLATIRGPIAADVLFRTETRLIQASGGSFGLEILAAHPADLLGESLISDVVKEFSEVLAIGDEVELLRERLLEMKPRAASKYGVFLNSLVQCESPFKLDWASPDRSRNRSVSLDLRTAAGALKTVQQVTSEVGEIRDYIGHFVGVELLRKTFTFVATAEDDPYRGKISESAMAMAEHVTLNRLYRVTIRETLEVTASGEEKYRFEVEKIGEV